MSKAPFEWQEQALRMVGHDARPEWAVSGLPWCTREDCPAFDGKRCRVVGARPSSICEPAVDAMGALLISAEAERKHG